MKSTLETIKEMEKEFDEAVYAEAKKRCFRSQTAVIFWDGFGGYDVEEKWKKEVMSDSNFVKSFISSYTRTLLESFGEEVIGQDTRHITDSKGIQNIVDENEGNVSFDEIANEVQKDIDVQNELRAEQRLKVKEIIENIKL